MKNFLLYIIALIMPIAAVAADDQLFPYPVAPDEMETMTERTNFVIEHFWDRCNMKSAFSTKQKLYKAFKDYINIIPYADAEVVHASVDRLIASVKKEPKNLLTLAEFAEATLYADTAEIISDEVYLPFAKAVAECKKIKPAEKARFEHHARILAASQVGMTAPDFSFTDFDGNKHNFNEVSGGHVLLFFNSSDCDDCSFARVRLSADYNINDLISRGLLKVVSIHPGDNDSEWAATASKYPDNWIVGASADVDQVYDMRNPPVIYYLDREHKILSKSMTIDQLINAFAIVNAKMKKG